MFGFLPLINNSVTIELIFLLLIISVIIASNTINTFRFLFGLYSQIFENTNKYSSILFEYSIKTFESFKYFKYLFSHLLIKNLSFALFRSFAYK